GLAIDAEAFYVGCAGAGVHPSADGARGDQGCGFGAMNVFERGEIGFLMLGFEVHDLAADHTVDGARSVRNLADDCYPRLGGTVDLREHLVGLSLQSIASQDCRGFAESLVAGWPAAAEVVVVEGGQVIVDERI